MGRHCKCVRTGDGIDRRESGYYSTPDFIADYLAREILRIRPDGTYVLDPCVGKEELLGYLHGAGKHIDAMDVVDFGVHDKATFERKDFLDFYMHRREMSTSRAVETLKYDYYIANPPYNCHETEYIRTNKARLRRSFPTVGASNMYAMFISAMIEFAKPGAVIGLITFDSFLHARTYKPLRQQILSECAVHNIILCPVDLFWDQKADVRTCLLILQKGKDLQAKVKTANRPLHVQQLRTVLERGLLDQRDLSEIVLDSRKDLSEFTIGCPADIKELFNNPRLGERFRCVTGISTGNDTKYVSRVPSDSFCVPFYKNPASRRFYMEPDGFLPDNFLHLEKTIPNFMIRNKDLLFKSGISCSSMGIPFTACHLPANSAFGVNATIVCEPADTWWLMSYLNSSLVTYMVRGIIIRTNMITSGYVARIPLIPFSAEQKESLERISADAVSRMVGKDDYKELLERIDEIVLSGLGLATSSVSLVRTFCSQVQRYT